MTAENRRGQQLGPYRLVRPLGAGSSGEVWEAVLHGPGGFRKPVALKLLSLKPTDDTTREAVIREARLGALLQHPNVVSTLQVGEHDGTWCVALELVRGPSVETLCQRAGGALPPAAVLEVGIQAAAGLAHAHTADGHRPALVHRDVKPANLLVDPSGIVKLADLGVSLLQGESIGVAGTPGFMAPEQVGGRPEPRSDLFSLGAVLYTLATGRRPFGRGKPALVAAENVEGLLAEPSFLGPLEHVVPGLASVVRACLRHDPALRLRSARELADALGALRGVARGPLLVELLGHSPTDAERDPAPPSDLPTLVVAAGNLRRPRDAFVGRAAELEEVEALVHAERWVVLVATGGMGKSRLALEVARRVETSMAGGAWFFDLCEARTADAICAGVAGALGLELDRADPVAHVGRVLGAKGRALVVLDNLEQCVGALAATVLRWLDLAPGVTFLGTSRIVPALPGERAVRLGELDEADAVALFEERAPRPLTEAERPVVGPLCRALDRIPLALELAAARLRVLDVAGIRARVSLALLAGGGAERPERHRSVTASLRWSWELLSATGRHALAALSVFEGGFDVPAAEAVLELGAPGAPWALDVVQELADASLLQVDPAAGRFWLLVVVREFAAGLATPAVRAAAEARHGAHYAQRGTPEALEALDGPDGEAPGRLARELDNVLVACRRAIARGDGAVAAATLAAADAVLRFQGPHAPRVELAQAVLAMPSLGPRERLRALRSAVGALVDEGPGQEALRLAEETLALCRAQGDRRGEAQAIGSLGVVHRKLRQVAQARECFARALDLHSETGARRGEATARNSLGLLELDQGMPEAGAEHLERALAIFREEGHLRGQGLVLGNVAMLEYGRGRLDRSASALEQALAVHRAGGNLRFEGIVLGNLAVVREEQGRAEEALALCERALAAHREVGSRGSEGVVELQIGGLLHATGRPAEAERRFERALSLSAGDLRSEGEVWTARGRAAADPPTALAHLARGEALLRQAEAPVSLAHLLVVRAEVLLRSADADAAGRALDEAEALAPRYARVAAEVARVRASISRRGA